MSRKDLTPQTREGGNWCFLPEVTGPLRGTVPLSHAGSDPSGSSLVLTHIA